MQWWLNILHESRLEDLVHDGGYGDDNSGGVGGSGGDGGVAKVDGVNIDYTGNEVNDGYIRSGAGKGDWWQ